MICLLFASVSSLLIQGLEMVIAALGVKENTVTCHQLFRVTAT